MDNIKAPKNKIVTLDNGQVVVLVGRPDGNMCLAVKVGDNVVLRPAGDLTIPPHARAATYLEVGSSFVRGHSVNKEHLTEANLQEMFLFAHDGGAPPSPFPPPAEPVTP